MKAKISKTTIDALTKGETITDTQIPGFDARCLPSGVITYGFRYRRADGTRCRVTLGLHGSITADEARTQAKKAAGKVADGKDPAADRDAAREQAERDETKTVNAVLDEHVKRHVEGLRSADAIKSAFDRLVRPVIGGDLIYDVKRSDIVEMLDDIEDEQGPVMADRTLAFLRKAFNWQMTRDDKFFSPIIKGMGRVNAGERARQRILTDEEIFDVWRALDLIGNQVPVCYPQFIRSLLLTAQRRSNVANWHSDQIKPQVGRMGDIEGFDWIIDSDHHKNGRTHLVPITAAARALLVRDTGFMVSSDGGKTAFSGFSKTKRFLDAKIAEMRKESGRSEMPHWVLHDLRRTARSIVSRYTTPDIAERVIGHAIGGVRGVYDHYAYADEKRVALEKLAIHVMGVVHPDSDKIVPLRALRG
jgi:integrase